LSTGPSATIAGIVLSIIHRFRANTWLGWAITTIASGLFTLLSPETSNGERIGYFILMGIGCGLLFPSLLLSVQVAQASEDVAIATSTFAFIRSLGQTFGVAIGGLIFQNEWNQNLAELIAENKLPPSFQIDGRQAESAVLFLHALPSPELGVVKQLYSESLRTIWIFYIPLSGFAFLASLLMKDYSLITAPGDEKTVVASMDKPADESSVIFLKNRTATVSCEP